MNLDPEAWRVSVLYISARGNAGLRGLKQRNGVCDVFQTGRDPSRGVELHWENCHKWHISINLKSLLLLKVADWATSNFSHHFSCKPSEKFFFVSYHVSKLQIINTIYWIDPETRIPLSILMLHLKCLTLKPSSLFQKWSVSFQINRNFAIDLYLNSWKGSCFEGRYLKVPEQAHLLARHHFKNPEFNRKF